MSLSKAAIAVVFALSCLTLAEASTLAPGEPAFCDLATFESLEVPSERPGLLRSHAYHLGNLVLVGVAVGKSQVSSVQDLANDFSQFSADEKSCTWYLNDGNGGAAQSFHHRYVPNPNFKGPEIAEEYEKTLSDVFFNDPVSFMSCAAKHGYIALGCDGQKHRGPSVFAMLLSYAGCSPKNATAIANKVWGTNFVRVETREAIASKGKILGDQNPVLREQLQILMGVPTIKP
jgi:hypothetical protein